VKHHGMVSADSPLCASAIRVRQQNGLNGRDASVPTSSKSLSDMPAFCANGRDHTSIVIATSQWVTMTMEAKHRQSENISQTSLRLHSLYAVQSQQPLNITTDGRRRDA
jgi:hypothetical protein